jgi:hypothetical protein
MQRFYAICGPLVVVILLVGPVHAGPPHSRQRSGHQSRQRSGYQSRRLSGRHWRVLRPRPELLPWQWLPEQPPAWWGSDPDSGPDDPNAGGSDPISRTDGPNAEGSDPNVGGSQPGEDIGGGKVARPAVTPKGSSQRRLPEFGNSSRPISGAGSGR